MRTKLIQPLSGAIVGCLLASAALAQIAQPYYGENTFTGAGSTAAGSTMAGMGQVIRSQGQANLMNSQATINLEQAAKMDMENQVDWTNTYFEKRKINQAYAASQKPAPTSPDAWVRLAHDTAPKRLPPGGVNPVSGTIAWPSVLLDKSFDADRAKLDRLFADRADRDGAIGFSSYGDIRKTTDAMLAKLKDHIRDIDTKYYMEARTFLTGLAREADFPVASAPPRPRPG